MNNILIEYNRLCEPDWYLYFEKQLRKYFYDYEKQEITKDFINQRNLIVNVILKALKNNTLGIGNSGENFDKERKPIDTIIIHMTSTSSQKNDNPRDLDYLNALDLIRLYASEYSREKNSYFGKPIFAGHYYNNKQIFIPYHYLINPDGSYLNILKDEYIGWHAGNWNINCRSIAIAFVGNFINSKPSSKALVSAKDIIHKYKDVNIFAHKEVTAKTECPGNRYISWKKELIN